MVGHRHEIEAPRGGGFQRPEYRAGGLGAGLCDAGSVGVAGVQVQVTAIPAGAGLHRGGSETGEDAAPIQGDCIFLLIFQVQLGFRLAYLERLLACIAYDKK